MSDTGTTDEPPTDRPAPMPYTIDQLIAGITDENRLDETEWGPPVGAEVW